MTPKQETTLTVEEVVRRVEKIRAAAGDEETAHSMEDALYLDVLRAIAEGRAEAPHLCAAAALATRGIEFRRWCA